MNKTIISFEDFFMFGHNFSDENITVSSDDIFTDPDVLLISLYIAVILLSVTANTLVVTVVIKYHHMRNVTNIFLVNLSIADLFVTFVSMVVGVTKAVTLVWIYGIVMCKIIYYLQGVAVAASVFTITAMSVDRYMAISQSMIMQKLTRKTACVTIFLLWLVALSIFLPLLWIVNVKVETIPLFALDGPSITFEICFEDWDTAPQYQGLFGDLTFVMVFAIPGCIIFMAYSLMGRKLCSVQPPFDDNEGSASTQQSIRLMRERKKVALILLLLAILFAVCWLPYNLILLLVDNNWISNKTVIFIMPYALLLGHTNSAINPIVYCFMTKNFRKSVRKLICGSPENLSNRHHQRCKIRWPACAPTPSSGYDSYHSPHKKCFLQMHSLKINNGGTQMTTSGTRVSRRLRSGSVIAKHLQPGTVLDRNYHPQVKQHQQMKQQQEHPQTPGTNGGTTGVPQRYI